MGSRERVSVASKAKSVNKKKSVKQYKILKKSKLNNHDYPNFVLDSFSINDRLTTQPDRGVASSASLQYENNGNISNMTKY